MIKAIRVISLSILVFGLTIHFQSDQMAFVLLMMRNILTKEEYMIMLELKFWKMHGKDIIVVFSLMVKLGREKVIQWLVLNLIVGLCLLLVKKYSKEFN